MDTPVPTEVRPRMFRLAMDIGLAAGLLLAVMAVLIVDLSGFGQIHTVDLVFILDQRPAMRGVVKAMLANCVEKAEGLQASGLDCRFAVVPFGAKQNRISPVPLTSDVADFKRKLLDAPVAGAPDAVATSAEALGQAMALDFRKDAQVLFFLISKVPSQDTSEITNVAKELDQRGIMAIVQADAGEQDRCRPLYQNGRFYSMEGDDLTGSRVAGQARSKSANLLARLAPDSKADGSAQLMGAKGLFSLRTAPNREQLILSLGGTKESEMAVQAGLSWLARHQADDGHWSDDVKCEHGGQKCQLIKYGAANAETGLAILAFQAGGNYHFNNQTYSGNVTRGLDWLVMQQQRDGCLFGTNSTWYEHGIATFALAEACAVALANNAPPDARYLDAARRAIKFIEDHQYKQGGWQYLLDSQGLGDTSVTGWQALALKSAQEAGIEVAPATMEGVRKFFEACGDPQTGRTAYQGRGSHVTDLTTAVGLIVQEFILEQPKSPLALKAVGQLQQRAGEGIGQSGDFYTLYNGTLAMRLAGGKPWEAWNGNVRDAIVKRQETQGCARGSWNHHYHRTLDTAWAVLTLEVYYRYSAEQE